jgi:hypothetical protein
MYQENPEKDFFDEVMDLIGSDSKDSAAVAVRHTLIIISCISSLTTDCTRTPPQTSDLHASIQIKLYCDVNYK